MQSPFDLDMPMDFDLEFAVRAVAVFGPRVVVWREVRLRLLRRLMVIFDPLQTIVAEHRVATARAVASSRHIVLMSFVTALLRWPDRAQPMAYVKGFRVMGQIDDPGIFRKVPATNVDDIEHEFYGKPAEKAVKTLMGTRPSADADFSS